MGVLLTLFLAVAVLTVLKWLSQARFHYSHGVFYHRPCQLFMFELEGCGGGSSQTASGSSPAER